MAVIRYPTTSANGISPVKFVVNQTPGLGTHTTIQSAITAANSNGYSGVILIMPGSYVENVNMSQSVSLCGWAGDTNLDYVDTYGYNGSVIINGLLTLNGPGYSQSICNVTLLDAGSGVILFSGSSSQEATLLNCLIKPTLSPTAITISNSQASSRILFKGCTFRGNSGTMIAQSNSTCHFEQCQWMNSAPTNTTVSISAGTMNVFDSIMNVQFSVTGTGSLNVYDSQLNFLGNNQTPLTLGGSGTQQIYNSYIGGGTSSAISISTTATVDNCVINSSNTNAITGAGTINYARLSYAGSSITNNVTTQNTYAEPVIEGGTGIKTAVAYSPICGGTTATGAFQSVASLGSAGQVLTSNGTSSLPTFQSIAAGPASSVTNLGIAYSAGTFTVQGATAALSASNPAYVTFQDPSTPGLLKTITVTANQTFTDGTGNLDTWQCGVPPTNTADGSASSDWAQDMPFFLYAVLGTANDVAFMIARNPCASTSPAAANISKTGTILNVDQTDMFSLLGGTIANYASRPCVCLGSFRMRNVVTGGNIRYTVQSLSVNDGIGKFQEGIAFTFPAGVNNNYPSRYFSNGFGTLPVFGTNTFYYSINRSGLVTISINLIGCTTSGVGATSTKMALPYANFGSLSQIGYSPSATWTNGATDTTYATFFVLGASSRDLVTLRTTGSFTNFTNASWSNTTGGDSFELYMTYKAF